MEERNSIPIDKNRSNFIIKNAGKSMNSDVIGITDAGEILLS